MISNREITRAYLAGDDIHAIIQRRIRAQAIAAVAVVAPLAFLGLYVIKSAMGINLFEDFHLIDLFTM